MKWFTNYAKVKGTNLVESIQTALVNLDLDGASEADLMTIEGELDLLTKQAAEQRGVAEKERGEAVVIVAEYNQKLAAIEILQGDLTSAIDQDTINQLTEIINEEVTELEAMLPEIEREKQEAEEAESDLAQMCDLAKAAADTLKTARKNLDTAKKNLERQQRNVQTAQQRADRQAQLQGLTSNVGKLNTALSIMNKQADGLKTEAVGLKMKADLLGAGNQDKSDLMKAAMAKAAGKPVASTSIADRLAALKTKQ